MSLAERVLDMSGVGASCTLDEYTVCVYIPGDRACLVPAHRSNRLSIFEMYPGIDNMNRWLGRSNRIVILRNLIVDSFSSMVISNIFFMTAYRRCRASALNDLIRKSSTTRQNVISSFAWWNRHGTRGVFDIIMRCKVFNKAFV